MTELETRREIIYVMDECKYNGKPILEYIEGSGGINVEILADMLIHALRKKGFKFDN
jgi:hypothetical protein